MLNTDIENSADRRDITIRTFYCLTNVTVVATHIFKKRIGVNEEDSIPFCIKHNPAVWKLEKIMMEFLIRTICVCSEHRLLFS